ncbi:MAG: tetratricopeptide repeat protein [bacterium]|nr:tetratricopeptide repeat protein [bacterium]
MSLKQETTGAVLNKIILLRNNKKFDEAIELAQKAFRNTKNNCFNNEIYNCFVLQNKTCDAIKILTKMLRYEPENLLLLKKLARSYFISCDYKNALKYYKKVSELEPANSDNQYATGLAYHYLNNRKKAYQYYRNALNINPKHIASINNIGLLYYEAKDFENAIKVFKTAINYSPDSPEAYHHLGIIQRIYANDNELSELYLKKAIRLDSKYADNYYQLALTYNTCGKRQEAIDALQNCLKLSPKNRSAKQLLKKIS